MADYLNQQRFKNIMGLNNQEPVTGAISTGLNYIKQPLDYYALNKNIPAVGGMSAADFLGLTGTQGLLQDFSEGKNITGDMRMFDAMGLLPTVAPAVKVAGKASKALGIEALRQMNEGTGLLGRLTIDPRQYIFIGENSNLWNSDLAKKAVELEKKGVSPENIWRQTGTLKGVDGKLRQEISDDAVKSVLATPNSLGTFSLDDIITGSKSFDAYPQLKNINVTKGNETYFSPSENVISSANFKNQQVLGSPYQNQENRIYKIAEILDAQGKTTPKTEARLESMLEKINRNASKKFEGIVDKTAFSPQPILHEQQHAIQELEGWAKGGSVDEMGGYSNQYNQAKTLFDEALKIRLNPNAGKIEKDNARQIMEFYGPQLSKLKKISDPKEAYKRLAGEAESRLTERRMNLTPEERLQYFPYNEGQYGLDVPLNELIVKGLLK